MNECFATVFGIPAEFPSPDGIEASVRKLQSAMVFEPELEGKVKASNVLIGLRPKGRNSFAPVFAGAFREEGRGSVLSGRITLHPFAKFFMGVSLGAMAVLGLLAGEGLLAVGLVTASAAFIALGQWMSRKDIPRLMAMISTALSKVGASDNADARKQYFNPIIAEPSLASRIVNAVFGSTAVEFASAANLEDTAKKLGSMKKATVGLAGGVSGERVLFWTRPSTSDPVVQYFTGTLRRSGTHAVLGGDFTTIPLSKISLSLVAFVILLNAVMPKSAGLALMLFVVAVPTLCLIRFRAKPIRLAELIKTTLSDTQNQAESRLPLDESGAKA